MGLAYDPSADRLQGGDFIGDFHGRPVMWLSLSMRRAKLIFEAAKELRQAYDELPRAAEAADSPFSQPLAVLELNSYPVVFNGESTEISIDQLFMHPDLAMAPPEYRQLTRMMLVLPGPQTLAESGFPAKDVARLGFVRQLFRTLACAHLKVKMTFSRQNGSSIGPASLTAAGEIFDIYYLTRSSEAKERFDEYRKADVMQSLQVAAFPIGSPTSMMILDEAARTYLAAVGSEGLLGTDYVRQKQRLITSRGDENVARSALEAIAELLIVARLA